MGIFGGGDDVTITISGQSDGLQGAVKAAEDSLRSLSGAADSGNQSFTGYRFTMQSLGNDLLNNLGSFGAMAITLNSVIGIFGTIGGAITNVVGGVFQFVESLAQVAASDAWQALSFGANEAERLGQAMFELSNATEKNVNTWQFIYGGKQNASDLAAWTQQFSMQIPYTRQDLMNAVTALGRTGMTESDIKQYMPTVADLGTLNPNLDLTQIAFAIQGAQHGYTRMLRYDLGINPDDLKAYGLAIDNHGHITDTSTLMPALEKFAQARGIGGAAQRTATGTFWGAASSFEDRVQNFLLAAGGTQASGDVTQGSFFGNLKQDLTDLNAWIDAHQSDLKKVADIVSQLYGNGLATGRDMFTSFMEALHGTGIDTQLMSDLSDFAHWLGDPATQEGARELGDMVGKLTGVAGIDLRSIFGSLWQGLTASGIGQTLLDDIRNTTQWLADPANQQMLQHMGYILGVGIGDSLQTISTLLGNMGQDAQQLMADWTPTDLMLIAGAFAEITLAVSVAANTLGGFALEVVDVGNLIADYSAGNYAGMASDYLHMQHDLQTTQNQNVQAYNQSVNQAAQLDILFNQWQQQQQQKGSGSSGRVAGHVSEATAPTSLTAARVAQESHALSGHGRAMPQTGQMGASLTEGVSNGMIGDLSHMTRAGQQVMGQFADALIAASTGHMNSLGQHVATVIGIAIEQQIAAQFRIQDSQNATAAQMPGGYGRFAFGGGRAPW